MPKKDNNFSELEKKWQKKWEEKKIFQVKEDSKKKKFYVLEMFPYPSGSGLHMGHAFNYSIGDIFARFKRMNGYNVLYPMGYDSFGLPAENAAIKEKKHPKIFTEASIKNFIKQQKELGLSYDWSRILMTHSPEYYKWNQYFFLKFLENDLAYRKKSSVNWCPKCTSVLANEQVHNGKCWRHGDTDVEIKNLEQWFIRTSKYSEELLKTEDLIWPQRIKTMQKNWIGKSEGAEIDFEINGKKWPIFTTRPDTIFGVTFMVVSAQHPKLNELITKEQEKEVSKFLKKIKSVSEKELESMEKEGAFTGSYAKNPMNGEKIPIYTGNFVVADYGSGMVMGVPAHDQRDFDFAKKYNIPIKEVIQPVTGIPKDNEEFRRSIVAVVENPKNGKILSINWGNKLGGNLFVGGGMEEGEDAVNTAIREIKEETGYKNVKFISKTGKIKHHYRAHSKNVDREIEAIGLHFQLVNEEKATQKLSKDEKNKFSVEWINKEEAASKVKDELHNLVFRRLILGEAYTDSGILINSKGFDGLFNEEAKEHIVKALEIKKLGRKITQYKFRDWLVSRQRYWGTPIPVVYCDDCGIVPVKEKDLPIVLPDKVTFGKGNPLETNKKFLETKCPKCGKKARRETDTMDTFFDSSWYFLRFCDSKNEKQSFDQKKVKYWMPVDQYIGGAEHATMHLIYARFFVKALRDMGMVNFDEPFKNLFNQGMLHGPDGFVMSKSRGNVVLPEEISNKYGIDTARLFLVSIASPDKDIQWSDQGIEGSYRFVSKVMDYFNSFKAGKIDARMESRLHKTIKEVSSEIENFQYNIAVIKIREFFSHIENGADKKTAETFLKLLHPICPHITEELWSKLGNKSFISLEKWPQVDEKKINSTFEKEEKIIDDTINDVNNVVNIVKSRGKDVNKLYLYALPNEIDSYKGNLDEIKKRTGLDVVVSAVNDKNKHDPENKSKKARPGKPGIYLE